MSHLEAASVEVQFQVTCLRSRLGISSSQKLELVSAHPRREEHREEELNWNDNTSNLQQQIKSASEAWRAPVSIEHDLPHKG